MEGDAHAGVTVQHLSRIARDPSQPNLRQVHLLAFELIEVLRESGFDVNPGQLGENMTTRGIALTDLSRNTHLSIGDSELVITGLRNPCQQIEKFRPGLLNQVVSKTSSGDVIRRAGIMAIVARSGTVSEEDDIKITSPKHFEPLQVV